MSRSESGNRRVRRRARLMVDAGAESTWIDAAVLEAIGIEPRKEDLQFQLRTAKSLRVPSGMPCFGSIRQRQ
jgi:hypothetical protein